MITNFNWDLKERKNDVYQFEQDFYSQDNFFVKDEKNELDFISKISFSENSEAYFLPMDQDILNVEDFENKFGKDYFTQNEVQEMKANTIEAKIDEAKNLSIQSVESTSNTINNFDGDISDKKMKKRKRYTKISGPRRKRKDIVFKSLLRRCRKYFQADFDHFSNYTKLKKRRSDGYFYEQVNNYVQQKFELVSNSKFSFYFAAFINSKVTKNQYIKSEIAKLYPERYSTFENNTRDKMQEEVEKIHDILYHFTYEKMILFFEYQELGYLFKHFANSTKQYIPKGFHEQLETMLGFAFESE